MDAKDLAREVIHVLDLQREYFRTRQQSKLNECRDAERRLLKLAEEVLNPPQPGLFG